MGNINYNNFICENYYCQSVSFKPEWLSESTWNITYNYLEEEKIKKPYLIDKGILKISNVNKFELLFSKKLLIDFNQIRNISIPINFKYYLTNNNSIDIFFIFSNNQFELNNLNSLNTNDNNLFFIKLNFIANKINIFRSFNEKIFTKKIKFKKINTFIISLENNFKILLVNEKLYNNKFKILYDEKHLNNNFDNYDDFYLNLYIRSKNGFLKKDFIELNFE